MYAWKMILLLVAISLALTGCTDKLLPEDRDLVEYVAAAFDNAEAQQSFRLELDLETTLEATSYSGGEAVTEKAQLKIYGDGQILREQTVSLASTSTLTMDVNSNVLPTEQYPATMEIIQLGETVFVRLCENSDASTCDSEWVDVTTGEVDVPNLEVYDWQRVMDFTGMGTRYEINPNTVLDIEALESQSLGGQQMRVFRIELAFDKAFSHALSSADPVPFSPFEMTDLFSQMSEDVHFETIIWVGVEDHLLHRNVDTMTFSWSSQIGDTSFEMDVQMHQSVTYSDFNEPVEIEAPIVQDASSAGDSQPERLLLTLRQGRGGIEGAVWNRDGTLILSWARNGTARVWDAETGEELLRLQHDHGMVGGAAWNADETRILTWSWDGTARVWHAQRGELLLSLAHESEVWGATWNADETRILTWNSSDSLWGCGDECAYAVNIWDATNSELLLTLPHHNEIRRAGWSNDESRIFSLVHAAWDCEQYCQDAVLVWDAGSGEALFTMEHPDIVRGTTRNVDGTRILTWSSDRLARVWDAETGELLHTLQHNSHVHGATWNTDESRILTWSYDSTARIWDAETGDQLVELRHEGPWGMGVDGAAWNDDGTRVLTWSTDNGTVKVWRVDSGEELFTLPDDEYRLERAKWNADETLIISLSWSGVARIWDAETGDELLALRQANDEQAARDADWAVWNADETRLLTWSNDGVIKVWDASGIR